MTPNTSDRPDAMRNKNIAVVSPPRNWPNKKDDCMDSDNGRRTTEDGQAQSVLRHLSSVFCPQFVNGPWERYLGSFMTANGWRSSLTIWPQNSPISVSWFSLKVSLPIGVSKDMPTIAFATLSE